MQLSQSKCLQIETSCIVTGPPLTTKTPLCSLHSGVFVVKFVHQMEGVLWLNCIYIYVCMYLSGLILIKTRHGFSQWDSSGLVTSSSWPETSCAGTPRPADCDCRGDWSWKIIVGQCSPRMWPPLLWLPLWGLLWFALVYFGLFPWLPLKSLLGFSLIIVIFLQKFLEWFSWLPPWGLFWNRFLHKADHVWLWTVAWNWTKFHSE